MAEPIFPRAPIKRRGRPPGVRNRPRIAMVRPGSPREDYSHSDPDTLVSRQLLMLDWAQQSMRNAMRAAMDSKNPEVQGVDVVKLEKLSTALVKTIDALKKSSDLVEELASRMTPEQLLEAALKKLESQDSATLRYAVKRLRAKLESVQGAPVGPGSAVDAIASLEDS